jgi:hypothetical protein
MLRWWLFIGEHSNVTGDRYDGVSVLLTFRPHDETGLRWVDDEGCNRWGLPMIFCRLVNFDGYTWTKVGLALARKDICPRVPHIVCPLIDCNDSDFSLSLQLLIYLSQTGL